MKEINSLYTAPPAQRRWNPLHWPLWAKITGAMLLLAAIVALAVGIHEAVENAGPYPDYTPLNYTLQDAFHGESFFDGFDYFTDPDPTNGFVQYQSAAASRQRNLTYASSTSAVLRVDDSDTNAANGRASVRITSKTHYDSGLFVFDVAHAPYGCTLWPSIWLADPSRWPLHGEIDVLEAVETGDAGNEITLHTTAGCSMAVRRRETGVQEYTTCLNSTNYNDGCGVRGGPETYGAVFNANGGGVYALELRTAGIRVWAFPRARIPAELSSLAITASTATPDPATWGEALADFPATHCDVGQHFSNQSIIANIDVCGTWAGQQKVYGEQFGCPGTCEDYARHNASGYGEAYWEINGFWVFKAV